MNYLGVPFLTARPNRVFSAAERQRLEATVMDAQTGPRTVTPPTRVPAKSRSIEFLSFDDLGQVYELRKHLMTCQGRLKPFWTPSWQRDLVLAQSSGSGVGTITIKECGYATRVWPSGTARRHLALRGRTGTLLLRRVTAAVSNGNGTETLTLIGPAGEATLGVAVSIDWLVMFARYVRLSEDEIFIEWTGKAARCELPITDLVEETPS